MLDNSEQQQNPCIVCNQLHDQMLMLACIHDPCINCAAKYYIESQPNNSKVYVCSKCGDQTQLDKSSIAELTRIYNQNKKKRKPQQIKGLISSPAKNRNSAVDLKMAKFAPPSQKLQNYRKKERQEVDISQVSKKYSQPPISQPSYNSNPKKYQLEYPCADHPEEQLTYFCFTCTQPICPQCAIHGQHKDHQVQTTRKAIKQIRSLLTQNKHKLQAEVGTLLKNKEKNKKQNKELAQENKREQEYIRKKLTHLKNVIVEKEKQLLKASQVNFDRNTGKTKQQDQLIDKQIFEANAINKNIDITLKKQDLAILQEYSKRDQEVIELFERIQTGKQKIHEFEAKNPHKSIDLQLLDQDMDRLLNDIYSVKLGTTINKQQYSD